MTIKQLSVFLENKTGRINEVVRILGANEINMHAFSMAESTDFGILRLIVSDVDKAVCLSCDNVPGALAVILEYLAQEQIFIEYMYAFAQNDRANVVIKPNDLKHCVEVLQAHQCDVLTKEKL